MIHLRAVLLVGLGGFLGSILRYVTSLGVQRWLGTEGLPVGTLAVNVLGCLAIGVLGGVGDSFSTHGRLFLFVGVLGGFTTFSTFGYETLGLLRGSAVLAAILNVVAHVALGLLAAWGGYVLSASFLAGR